MSLSEGAKARYEAKITATGLKADPYAIDKWTEGPEDVPTSVQWSDVMIYMVSRHSAPFLFLGETFTEDGWDPFSTMGNS